MSSIETVKEKIIKEVQKVFDPEIGISLYDLGLIYAIDVDGENVSIRMTLTSMGCPIGPQLVEQVKYAVQKVDEIKIVDVDIVWTPPWDPASMASEEAKMELGII